MPIIYKVYPEQKMFSILKGKEELHYYLPKRLVNVFMEYLEPTFWVDFVATTNTKKIGQINAIEIDSFKKLEDRTNKKIFFDINKLREKMFSVLTSFKYLLFIDFEMTMPAGKGKFRPEIIQAGGILTDDKKNIIETFSFKIKPQKEEAITKRTEKFLNMTKEEILEDAKDFKEFYNHLRNLFLKYNPQVITWGSNDFTVLKDNAALYKEQLFFSNTDFTNMLKLYRNYYQKGRDISLFSAYQEMTKDEKIKYQKHDALDDAYMTKEIFFAFLTLFPQNYEEKK